METKSTTQTEMDAAMHAKERALSNLTRMTEWIRSRNVAFLVGSIGMIIMLIWGGSYKMTASGAESIIPLVSNSPLISWHFKIFGPYIGSDIIGLTEMIAALLIFAGYFSPKIGVIGGLIATLMFLVTSSMFISTPGTVATINGMHYMSLIGLFLFKDIMALSVSLYLAGYFGEKALRIEFERLFLK